MAWLKRAAFVHLFPTYKEVLRGCQAFVEREGRDPMYKVATRVISQFWGSPDDVADGLGVLLLTWNQAFYRYGIFDFRKLEDCVRSWQSILQEYRDWHIEDSDGPEAESVHLFRDLMEALVNRKGARSPVAAAKAMHLLAPEFFPLWDNKIARAYGCHWYSAMQAPERYTHFRRLTRHMCVSVLDSFCAEFGVAREEARNGLRTLYAGACQLAVVEKPLLKMLDEYNYAKYTQGWI